MRLWKVVEKLLSLVKPQAKLISFIDMALLLSRKRAEFMRTESRYWWGVRPVSRVKSRVK